MRFFASDEGRCNMERLGWLVIKGGKFVKLGFGEGV